MKLRALKRFYDPVNRVHVKPGDTIDATQLRGRELVRLGNAEPVEGAEGRETRTDEPTERRARRRRTE